MVLRDQHFVAAIAGGYTHELDTEAQVLSGAKKMGPNVGQRSLK